MVRRRAAGGSRPLLRHHVRGPRVPPGERARPGGVRRVPPRARDHLRARSSLLQRRRAADAATQAPPGGALSGLGGAKRLQGARAQHARRGLFGDPRRHRNRRFGRSRRRGHRADLDGDAARVLAGTVSGAHPGRRCRSGRYAGERGEVGARSPRPCDQGAGARHGADSLGHARPVGLARDRRTRGGGWRGARRARHLPAWAPGRERTAPSLARLGRPSERSRDPDRDPEGRRLQPLRPLPPREAGTRGEAPRGRRRRVERGARPGRDTRMRRARWCRR